MCRVGLGVQGFIRVHFSEFRDSGSGLRVSGCGFGLEFYRFQGMSDFQNS